MGQYWILRNLDNGSNLGGGKLGECLIDGSFNDSIPPLAIPTGFKPPKDLPSLFNQTDHFSWEKSTKAPPKCLPPQKEKLGHLQVFPDEIISHIFKSIETKEDIARFSLTNIYLFYIGYEVLQQRYMAEKPSWVGDRLMCVGDYARIEDLPTGVFTQEEVDNMKQYQDNLADSSSSIGSLDDYLREIHPNHRRVELGLDYDARERLMTEIFEDERVSWEYRSRIHSALFELGSPRLLYKSEHPWVLCNLSKFHGRPVSVRPCLLLGWDAVGIQDLLVMG
ncbi:unnamed protein product [Somion occarium]|uniref:F-box domain-containing protein n=1 Tax=Somion occarium TaxID=3059160 RepID=A0ABP1CML8_9APHY